ncbi:methylated-DNA--[protein]-cysteine S-methyltransferase [Terricaulis sp.]|uniref:methylated-DNA--[protein]-cysteine S-methyltransferase n=1 Tax=Terricaulis sp. TaxID=2768686 RepID=UPI0037845881
MISSTHKSPIGTLTLVSDGEAIVYLEFENNKYPAPKFPKGEDAVIRQAKKELDLYFAGKLKDFTVPVKPEGTAFQRACWKALTKIPYGATRSYGEQATKIGKPKAVRAVGLANGRNPIPIIIPCHRVIGANGSLTGFGGGLPTKQFLLELEQGQQLFR